MYSPNYDFDKQILQSYEINPNYKKDELVDPFAQEEKQP